MNWTFRAFAALGALGMAIAASDTASGQKQGGTLRVYHRDSPASMSIHEEGTVGVIMPMMGVFNNLVIFDQHIPQNSLNTVVPELATSWAWSEDGTELTFRLRDGVKWHDGTPFTAEDVKCTFDLLTNQGKEKLRLNYRETWWTNVASTTTKGDHEATLHLKRPQPALLALLASGDTPIYPCHVSPHDMLQHPIGTGPFKFVEYKPNQYIKVARNPDYWKPGRPYLDEIEYTIIANRSTAILAFIAGNFDMTFPYEVTIPLLKDIKTQAPKAHCDVGMASESIGMLVNGGRSGEAQEAGLGYPLQTAAGHGAASHLSPARCDLLAARGQRAHDDDEQPIQWLAFRRRLARQVTRGNEDGGDEHNQPGRIRLPRSGRDIDLEPPATAQCVQ
jgi:peptide/nickel transport system substrate-binding protein